MTEEYMKYIREEYPKWCTSCEEYSINAKKEAQKFNQELRERIEKYNKIQKLLTDERVSEFAKLINYEIKPIKDQFVSEEFEPLDTSIYSFIHGENFMETYSSFISRALKTDKYLVLCYVGSREPRRSVITHRRMSWYDDLYVSLELNGCIILKGRDYKKDGKNREKFKQKHDIIYAPDGQNFLRGDIFDRIKAEYLEEALRTNEAEAKKLILSKYGRK